MNNLPTPVRWADYPGKVEASVGSLRGPNTLGEYMVVVEVRYIPQTEKTRIGYAFAGKGIPNAYFDLWIDSNKVLSEAVRNNTGKGAE